MCAIPRLVLLALIGVWLTGCASVREAGPAPADWPSQTLPADWEARRTVLQGWDRFEIEGRVSVANAQEGAVATLAWRQQATRAAVDLQGPAGLGARRWQFETSAGANASALDDGRALEALLGVALPWGSVRYWLLGVPDPSLPVEERRSDDATRLAALTQAGWEVHYLDYRPVGLARVELPARLEIRRDAWRLRLAIREWRGAP